MTLTVVVGSSGSGKTTLLWDIHKRKRCTHLRQHHGMRPYIRVSQIPNFDPAKLPFWDMYDQNILVGGTVAGKTVTGLSGGQRRLLLFEIIYQRCYKKKEPLLILFDEPFSGVTDDYLEGFVLPRLRLLKYEHNIILVTNDHVNVLKELADSVITVSATDRSTVQCFSTSDMIMNTIPRIQAIRDLCRIGESYEYSEASDATDNWTFFWTVEVVTNKLLAGVAVFTVITFGIFVATFWNSATENAATVLIAGGILCYFCLSPYMLSLIDWRNCMLEETQALVHSASLHRNQSLKTSVTVSVMIFISLVEYVAVNLVVEDGSLRGVRYWVAMLAETFALCFPYIVLGIFTRLSFPTVQMIAGMPFLLLIFFSTTYSPGAGVEGLKSLRYVFARFYFWCMVPSVDIRMEGCPSNDTVNVLLMILSSCISLWISLLVVFVQRCCRRRVTNGARRIGRCKKGDGSIETFQCDTNSESSFSDEEDDGQRSCCCGVV